MMAGGACTLSVDRVPHHPAGGSMASRIVVAGACLALLAVTGCNEPQVDGTLDELTIQIETELSNTDAVNLDILWVIDNSVSMCQEQTSLAANVKDFVERFVALNVNLRMAVVTTDALSESESGRFHCKLPPPFPPNCLEEIVFPCYSDDDCTAEFGPKWVCKKPSLDVKYLTNANGSLNSTCRYKCSDNAECEDTFSQDPADVFQCIKPGGDPDAAGCLQPPAVANCPTDLPCVVSTEDDNIDLFQCTAVVGALQEKNPQLEQGLKAAVWALDKDPDTCAPNNSVQAQDFLRPDGFLLVVFVSDEDDVSLACGKSVVAEDVNQAACLGDTDSGGPLEPVNVLAARLKSVTSDPSRVLVAAIVGDVVIDPSQKGAALTCPDDAYETDAACLSAKHDAFKESKCCSGPYCANTYVCESKAGKADYGERYIKFVQQFGENGFVANICNDEGFGAALENIAESTLSRILRPCLPRSKKPGTALRVQKVSANGSPPVTLEGCSKEEACLADPFGDPFCCQPKASADEPDPEYVLFDSSRCGVDGNGKEISFRDALQPGETIQIVYEATILDYE
jgi:hypothetical protein